MHRSDTENRFIRTFNNHFIARLCTAYPDFSLQTCECLLEQAEIKLNQLQPPRLNPTMSAYTQLNCEFEFNRTPMAPPGKRIIVYNNPHNRRTRNPNGKKAWYVRPVMLHYRCLTVYIPNKDKKRISNPMEFSLANLTFPRMTSKDGATYVVNDLTHALLNPTPMIPLVTLGYKQTAALQLIT